MLFKSMIRLNIKCVVDQINERNVHQPYIVYVCLARVLFKQANYHLIFFILYTVTYHNYNFSGIPVTCHLLRFGFTSS